MGALLKYEFRKTWKMKLIVLCFCAFNEAIYLYGVFTRDEDFSGGGIVGLVLTTLIGMFMIAIYGIHVLSKDINTKQSYMLFMTPNSSYKILGAKAIENFGSFFLSGVFFVLLAIFDLSLYALIEDDMEGLFNLISLAFTGEIGHFTYFNFGLTGISVVVSCLYLICLGYLAVVVCATLLKGNKFNGMLSFIAFIILSMLVSKLHDLIFKEVFIVSVGRMFPVVAFYAAVTCSIYLITAWIMDNMLSV